MPVVELAGVTKAYENKVAVRNLDLSIDAGQMFGLLGPNGAGKTSSIRMMMGITLPDSGRISLFGKPFERASLDRVGYLPEERGLYKKMKVLDQLVFFGRLHGIAAEDATKRARDWASRMEISDSLDKKTQELSKGMQQKIQFIATLLHDPGLIVMDEPFSGLDPVNTTLLQDALLELKSRGRAILFSTHRMDQVEKLCDAICLVNNGEAVLSGKMREITQAIIGRGENLALVVEQFHIGIEKTASAARGPHATIHAVAQDRGEDPLPGLGVEAKAIDIELGIEPAIDHHGKRHVLGLLRQVVGLLFDDFGQPADVEMAEIGQAAPHAGAPGPARIRACIGSDGKGRLGRVIGKGLHILDSDSGRAFDEHVVGAGHIAKAAELNLHGLSLTGTGGIDVKHRRFRLTESLRRRESGQGKNQQRQRDGPHQAITPEKPTVMTF